MLDGVFTIFAAAIMLTAGAVSLKLAAKMIFGDTVRLSAAFVVSSFATLAAVTTLAIVGVRHAENSIEVFVPGIMFAVSSWTLAIVLEPFERTQGWRTYSKAFLLTMVQCIGVTVFGAAVTSVFIAGTWVTSALI